LEEVERILLQGFKAEVQRADVALLIHTRNTKGSGKNSKSSFCQHSGFEARNPGDFSSSNQGVDVVGTLMRENWFHITERLQQLEIVMSVMFM
jgi:hypothetical protein